MGLKESFPENAMAVTIVGEARKFIVRLLPSFRDLKLLNQKCKPVALKGGGPYRLNEVKIAFVRVNIHSKEQRMTYHSCPLLCPRVSTAETSKYMNTHLSQ